MTENDYSQRGKPFPEKITYGQAWPESYQKSAGLKYDSDKPRMELLDAEWLDGVAQVLTFGAKKYSTKGDCNCHVAIVEEILKFGQKDFVNLVTMLCLKLNTKNPITTIKESTDKLTKSDLLNGGVDIWLKTLMSSKQNVEILLNENMDYPIKNWIVSSHNKIVQFVEVQKHYVLTMTTNQEKLEIDCAKLATSLLDSLKEQNGYKKHKDTCPATKEIRTGAHNWRGGISYSRLLGAAFRHLFSFLRGEDTDAETGLSHLLHASCCLMFLYWHTLHRADLDDRWRKE